MKRPLLVACRVCGAEPCEPCRNRNGRTSKQIHRSRSDDFRWFKFYAVNRPRIRWRATLEGKRLIEDAAQRPCTLCRGVIHPMLAEIDHIVPFSLGGIDDLDNLRVICGGCNRRRPRDGSDLIQPLDELVRAGLIDLTLMPTPVAHRSVAL